MYDDEEDDDKTAQEDSAHAVREAPASNIPPTFPTPSEQMNTDSGQGKWRRTRLAGTNVGAPVEASDPDVLTYSARSVSTAATSFSINRATGQLSTKAALNFEGRRPLTHEFDVTVTATDPFGAYGYGYVDGDHRR